MHRKLLGAKVSLWQVLLLNALTLAVVVMLAVAATAVGAFNADSFRPSGSTRIASTTSTTPVTVAGSNGEKTIQSITFSVPSGMTADILVFWNGEVQHASATTIGSCLAKVRIDNASTGSILSPGEELTLDGTVLTDGGSAHDVAASIQARKNAIGAGDHTLYLRGDSGGVGCTYLQRSMFVVADLY